MSSLMSCLLRVLHKPEHLEEQLLQQKGPDKVLEMVFSRCFAFHSALVGSAPTCSDWRCAARHRTAH
jgi:hypothetical protein